MKAVRRFVPLVATQGLSSLTNLLVALGLARYGAQDVFAAFAVALAVYSLLLGSWRALLGAPLLSARETTQTSVGRRRSCLGASLLLSCLATAILLPIGWVVNSLPLSILACSLPGLLTQEMVRQVSFAIGRSGVAIIVDVIWLATVVCSLSILVPAYGPAITTGLFVAWNVGAWLSCTVGLVLLRLRPSIYGVFSAEFGWGQGAGYLAEYVTGSGVGQLVVFFTGAVSGIRSIGAIRAGQSLLGPMNVLYSAYLVGITLWLRDRDESASPTRPLAVSGAALGVAPLLTGAVLLVLPPSWGQQILGDTWNSAQLVAVFLAFGMVPQALVQAAVAGFRGIGAARAAALARAVSAPMVLALGILGAVFWQAVGAAVGLALGNLVTCFVYWGRYVALRKQGVPGG